MRRVFAVVAISIGAFGGVVLPRFGSSTDAVPWVQRHGGVVLVEERIAAGDGCNSWDESNNGERRV